MSSGSPPPSVPFPFPLPPAPDNATIPTDLPPIPFPINLYPPPLPGFFFPIGPQPFIGIDGSIEKPKRKQVKTACSNCAQACKRCDESRPCMRCRKYGLSDSCKDSQRKERKKGTKRGPYKRRPKADSKGEEGTGETGDIGTEDPSTSLAPLPPLPPPDMVLQNAAAAQQLFVAFQAALTVAGTAPTPENALPAMPPFMLPGVDPVPSGTTTEAAPSNPIYPFSYPLFPYPFPIVPLPVVPAVEDNKEDAPDSSPSMSRLTPPPTSKEDSSTSSDNSN